MKKLLLVAVALSLAFTAKAFAEEAKKAPEATKPAVTAKATPATTATTTTTTTTTTAKTETKPVTTTDSTLNGNITKLDTASLSVKDNAGKEWSFKVGTNNVKEYKVGDNVTVKYEKDNLKSIAKAK